MKTLNTYYINKHSLEKFIEEHRDILFQQNSRVLLQAFSGLCDSDYLKGLSGEIKELLPHVHIIGTTTAGEIMNGEVSGLRTVLSFSVFQHTDIRSGIILKNDKSDYELGQILASRLTGERARVMILFATGITVNAVDLLSGIQSVNPSLPVAGGNASDNFLLEQTFVFNDREVTDCGVVAVVLESDRLHVSSHWHLGWQPIGKEMTITKAGKHRIYSIDNMPAYKAYQAYLGLEDISNPQNAVSFPLVIERHGIMMARVPNAGYEDGSLGFIADIYEGERVRFSYGHVDTILEGVDNLSREIRMQPAESIFVYSCMIRRDFLQNNIQIETMPLQKIAPSAGFFTHGEFFHENGTNQLLNATMTVLVLSESERADALSPDESNTKKVSTVRNNAMGSGIGTLRVLTHLVDTVTREFFDANEKLKYIGLHDTLTGLYNRAYFEEEMRRGDIYKGSTGIVVCDVDCLKLINDVLGHSFGDRVLCMAGECISAACRPQDIAARIGGDEFAIILPDADETLLEGICNRIINIIEQGKYSKLNKALNLSTGFAIKGPNEAKTMAEVFKIADLNMYRQKFIKSAEVSKSIIYTLTHMESEADKDVHEKIEVKGNHKYEGIVHREWAQTQVRREMERAAVLIRISSKLNKSSDDEAFNVFCEESASALKAPAAYLHLYDPNKEQFQLIACYGCEEQGCIIPCLADISIDEDIYLEDSPSKLEQIGKWLLMPLELSKIIEIKLIHEHQIIGVLSLCISDENFNFNDNDKTLINGLADLAVVHIVKSYLWQRNRRQLEAITTLYNNGQRLANSLDMSNIAKDVCRTYVEVFGAHLAWLGKAEEDGSIKVIGVYPPTDYPNKIIVRWDDTPAGRGPAGEAMRQGVPVVINDIKKEPKFSVWLEEAKKHCIESAAGFPLISRGKAFGTILVYGKTANFFDEDSTYYFQAYAQQAAAALENARLFTEAENRASHLESLRKIDIAITKSLDLNATLNIVLEQVMSGPNVNAANILLYNEEKKLLTYAFGRGFGDSAMKQITHTYDGEQSLKQHCKLFAMEGGLPYYYFFPLLSKGKLQGVLEIFSHEPFSKDREWRTFVNMLANQTAIAIDGIWLLKGLINSHERLKASYDETIEGWSRIMDLRDKETEGHSQRVAHITLRMAKALAMAEEELLYIRWGALLHDIGKMGIPDKILLKPGPLDENEWEIMKKHPDYAYDMLYPIEHLRPALNIPYAHHEKWDGTGYPPCCPYFCHC